MILGNVLVEPEPEKELPLFLNSTHHESDHRSNKEIESSG
jgi:hypothetical protein